MCSELLDATQEDNMYQSVVKALDGTVQNRLPDQVLDERRPDYGGFFTAGHGFAGPSHVGNAASLQALGLAYLLPDSRHHADPEILERILLSVAFQKRSTRPTGFVDIPQTNFDSPPDTGFVLQQLGSIAHLLAQSPNTPGVPEIEAALTPYLTACARAVAEGGFHTPNHRWVVASGMALVDARHPDPTVRAAIEAYLAEGIDLNEDGEYSERSAGGYNAVCDRSLVLMAEALDRPDLLEYVRRNLRSMLTLMQPDWTIITALSRRQDKGTRRVPTNAVDSFGYLALRDGDDDFCAATNALLDRGGATNSWLAYHFAAHPEWRGEALAPGKVAETYSRHMRASGVWRVRRGRLSATAATGVEGVFSVSFGRAELSALRVHSPYFAGASFTARSLDVKDNTATLELKSDFLLPQLPGYWLPLNRPVAWDDLPHGILAERETIPRPELEVVLTVTEVDGGFDLRIRTEAGMDTVPFQIECLFGAPGHVEHAGVSATATSGGSLLLKSGDLTYRVGADAITIGPGTHGHRNVFPMAGEGYRVYMTAWTPVDHSLQIRCHRWSESEGEYPSPGGPAELTGA